MAAPLNTQAVRTIIEGQVWQVPSRTRDIIYTVRRVGALLQCNCDNAMSGRHDCWHVRSVAVLVSMDMEWEAARKQAGLEEARRVTLARMMGRPV